MRFLALGLIVLGLCSQPVLAQSASLEGTSLIEFADQFDQAQLQKDGRLLEQMIADDLVFITGSGKRQGKRDFIAGWTDPADRYNPITLSDRVVTPLGPDAGMISAETVLSGTSRGKSFSTRFRFTDTFKRINGEWRAVHIQVTRISK